MRKNHKKWLGNTLFAFLALAILMISGTVFALSEEDLNDPEYIKRQYEQQLATQGLDDEEAEELMEAQSGIGPSTATANSDVNPYTGKSYNHGSKTGSTIRHGVDVSKWQGDSVDWAKVKAAGIDFVILRIGYTSVSGTTPKMYQDQMFELNYSRARAAGLKVGVYYFSQAKTVAEAKAEAEYTLKLLNGRSLQLPVSFDYESIPGYRNYGLSVTQGTNICSAYCDVIRAAGGKTMIYSNYNFFTEMLDVQQLDKNNEIWFARYGTYTYASSYTGYIPNYRFWQYAASDVSGHQGYVDGIGESDMNFWYDDGTDLSSTPRAPGSSDDSNTDTGSDTDHETDADSGNESTDDDSSSEDETEEETNEILPVTPTSLKVSTVNGTSLKLTWTAQVSNEGYVIYRADGAGCTFTRLATTQSNTYTDTGLVAGREYVYKIAGYRTNNGVETLSTASSQAAGITTMLQTTVVQCSATSLNVRSNAGSSYISLGTIGSGKKATLLGVAYASNGTEWYKIRVAINGKAVTGYVSAAYMKPVVTSISSMKQTGVGYTSIKMTWTEPSNVRGYVIYRADAYNGSYKKVASLKAGTNVFIDTGLNKYEYYFYKICPYVTVNGKNIYGSWSSLGMFRTYGTNVTIKMTKRAAMNKWNGKGYTRVTMVPVGTTLKATQRVKDKAGNWWFYCTGKVSGKTVTGFIRRDMFQNLG